MVQIQQFIKRIINHEQLGLISEMQSIFNIGKSLMHFTTSHINRLKNNNHMITENDAGKVFENLQHPFVIKAVSK